MSSNYVRRCPERAPHGSLKAAVAAIEIGEAVKVATQRIADSFCWTARQMGYRLRQRALHPYARHKPGQPMPPRCYELRRVE